MGSGVGEAQLGALLALAPQVQVLFIARFDHLHPRDSDHA